jgi:hypothetical protein
MLLDRLWSSGMAGVFSYKDKFMDLSRILQDQWPASRLAALLMR